MDGFIIFVISMCGGTEQYFYDPDGERLARSHGGLTTVYMAGLLEVDEQTGTPLATRTLYAFNGAVIAERNSAGGSLVYLHGDHLGSVTAATTASGGVASRQEFDPWGTVRPGGGVSQTSLNYTGQRKDDTGLLYYHARYYDPALARFVSADSIVSDAANPQALNRYSYVLNNPLRYVDPTGHVASVGDDGGDAETRALNILPNLERYAEHPRDDHEFAGREGQLDAQEQPRDFWDQEIRESTKGLIKYLARIYGYLHSSSRPPTEAERLQMEQQLAEGKNLLAREQLWRELHREPTQDEIDQRIRDMGDDDPDSFNRDGWNSGKPPDGSDEGGGGRGTGGGSPPPGAAAAASYTALLTAMIYAGFLVSRGGGSRGALRY